MTSTQDIVASIHAHGYFIAERALPTELVDEMLSEIDRLRETETPLR